MTEAIEYQGEHTTADLIVQDNKDRAIRAREAHNIIITDLQPVFRQAWEAADHEGQQAITQTWQEVQEHLNKIGAITEGMTEAIVALKEQRDTTVHDLTDLLHNLKAAAHDHRATDLPDHLLSYDGINSAYRGEVAELVESVNYAVHGEFQDDYDGFRRETHANILADLAAAAVMLTDCPYGDAKLAMAYLAHNKGLSTDERTRAAAVFRQLAAGLEDGTS